MVFKLEKMEMKVFEAIRKNDTSKFSSLVKENKEIANQREADSKNTILHFAVKFSNIGVVSNIVKMWPDLVAAENKDLETPIHEASRLGNAKILKLLLEANPDAATKFNSARKSALFIACSYGHLEAVNFLLKQSGIPNLGEDGHDQTCIHVAASSGITGW